MTFVSVAFLLLFIITYILCRFIKKEQYRHIILLFASYVFYGYWDVRFLALLILQTFISYALALQIEKRQDTKYAKGILIFGVSVSLIILGFFKYFNFFVGSFEKLFGMNDVWLLKIILPVGISFYTFQALSYLVDVYRKQLTARKSFIKISLYISFFPQLVAGPIVRATDFLPQLDEPKTMDFKNFQEGAQIFMFGLIKKVVIADRLAVCVDAVMKAPAAYSGVSLALAMVAYSLQIYCDFSGYSDMATGVAKAFGYDLCKNFNMPYISKNPTEFWKRWHISLSTWLMDYLYIPLGGNRKGKVRTYINLMLTMVLGGLWHGASWNFVVWGALHGVALIIHKLFCKFKNKFNLQIKNKYLKLAVNILSGCACYIFVCLTWVFFRTKDIGDAFIVLERIFTNATGVNYIFVFVIIYAAVIIAAYIFGIVKNNKNGYYPILNLHKFSSQLVIALVVFIVIALFYVGDTAFIYFQF